MDNNLKTAERNSNIELLRIILILFVLLLHLNNADVGGMFTLADSAGVRWFSLFTRFTESIGICAVDCFIIISGYFQCRKKSSKLYNVLNLIYLSMIFNCADYLLSLATLDVQFQLNTFIYALIPHRYFITFYCIVYIFSPFLNKLFESLTEKEQNIFILLIFSVFSVYPTFITFFSIPASGLSTVSISGNEAGYNVVNFLLCYYIGSWLRYREIKCKTVILLPIYLLSVLIMTKFPVLWNYDSVLCIFNAVIIFLIFQNIKLQSRVINYLAKSVFSIYLIHSLSNPVALWRKVLLPMEEYINQKVGNCIVLYLSSIFVIFVLCVIVDLIQKYSIGMLVNKFLKKVKIQVFIK